jgi:D-beta-D-heptose 7-phosphate kinase/D-beta-D-heptose 1-phosphate adenosyltransferase
MLDEYLWGHIERISPEAPVPILNVIRRSTTLGGAANVVENLRSWGVEVTVLGVVGEDETGKQVRELLSAHGADCKKVVSDPLRKSTRKSRLMSLEHGQQVFRLDEESIYPLDETVENTIIEMVHAISNGVQVILCSDYLKGVLSERVLTATFEKAYEKGIRTIVAPKDSNPERYRGANIVMANSRELMQLSGKKSNVDLLDEPAQDLIDKLSLEALVVTRGGEGMSLFEKSAAGFRRIDIPTMARSVYDVTGAGDTAIAAFAAAVASGSDLEMAAHLANITAGIKVGKRGTATVNLDEIRQSLREGSVGIQTPM